MKSTTSVRAGVMYMPLTAASIRLACTAGMMPVKSMPSMSDCRPLRLASSAIRSTSKPTVCPSRWNSNGAKVGLEPQVSLPAATVGGEAAVATAGASNRHANRKGFNIGYSAACNAIRAPRSGRVNPRLSRKVGPS